MHMQLDGVDWLPKIRGYDRTKLSVLEKASSEACNISSLLVSDLDFVQPVKMTLEYQAC